MYLKIIVCKISFRAKKEERHRISFMSNDTAPYASLLIKLRASQRDTSMQSDQSPPHHLTSLMSQRMFYGTKEGSQQSVAILLQFFSLINISKLLKLNLLFAVTLKF